MKHIDGQLFNFTVIAVILKINVGGHFKISIIYYCYSSNTKILRKVFGPERNNEGEYEIRSNKNLEELCNEPSIVGTLKSVRIGWA